MPRHRSMSTSTLRNMLTGRYSEDTKIKNLTKKDHMHLASSPGATNELRGMARAAMSNDRTRCAWIDIRN